MSTYPFYVQMNYLFKMIFTNHPVIVTCKDSKKFTKSEVWGFA